MAIEFEILVWEYGHLRYPHTCDVKGCFCEAKFCIGPKAERLCEEHLLARLRGTSDDSRTLLIEAVMTCLEKIQALEQWKEGK
jgi:hypothetical protein